MKKNQVRPIRVEPKRLNIRGLMFEVKRIIFPKEGWAFRILGEKRWKFMSAWGERMKLEGFVEEMTSRVDREKPAWQFYLSHLRGNPNVSFDWDHEGYMRRIILNRFSEKDLDIEKPLLWNEYLAFGVKIDNLEDKIDPSWFEFGPGQFSKWSAFKQKWKEYHERKEQKSIDMMGLELQMTFSGPKFGDILKKSDDFSLDYLPQPTYFEFSEKRLDKAIAEVNKRVGYGVRQEKTDRKMYFMIWSNGSKSWFVSREIQPGYTVSLDANEILIEADSVAEAELYSKFLPVLPLYYASSEAKSRREVSWDEATLNLIEGIVRRDDELGKDMRRFLSKPENRSYWARLSEKARGKK